MPWFIISSYPRRRNVTTLMVGLENGHIRKSLTQKWWTPEVYLGNAEEEEKKNNLIRKGLLGMEAELILTPWEKSPSTGNFFLRVGSNPRRCINQDSESNTLPTSYSGPNLSPNCRLKLGRYSLWQRQLLPTFHILAWCSRERVCQIWQTEVSQTHHSFWLWPHHNTFLPRQLCQCYFPVPK